MGQLPLFLSKFVPQPLFCKRHILRAGKPVCMISPFVTPEFKVSEHAGWAYGHFQSISVGSITNLPSVEAIRQSSSTFRKISLR